MRDELWQMAVGRRKQGAVMQVWSDHSPQGYSCRLHGDGSRNLVDFEGIVLAMKAEREQPRREPRTLKDRAPEHH